ncbi:MAG: hypothetical protein ABI334_05020 [Candidatus Dormiibacterota bacterium]
MRRLLSWPVAFGKFWYEFIVGDDWTVAAAVGLGLLLTALLTAAHVPAWWLVPLIVITMLGVSLRRAGLKA